VKPNFAFWVKAVRVMPRLTREEWDDLDVVSRWLVSTRFAAVVLTVFSVLIAGLLAYEVQTINVLVWIAMLVALLFAHGTNNIINDLVDFRRGIDTENYFRDLYGPQPLEKGFRTQKQQVRYAIVNAVIAIGIGVAVCAYRGGLSWAIMGAGLFFMVFYTYPLKYFALGELSLLLVWGPLMIAGGYYVLVGTWSWLVVLASLPYALGVTATLMGKHIDKFHDDKRAGVHTLPVVLGEGLSRGVVVALIVLQYLITAYLIVIGFFTPVMALIVFALPYFVRTVIPMFAKPRPTERPADYPETAWPLWFVSTTFVYSRKFGALFVLALIIDTVLQAVVL
jgi:1,4-dihydroxy-2-naphthoate octaprenyltransferase